MSDCRACGTALRHSFCDLGTAPPSNAFLRAEQLNGTERFYPLHALVCDSCWLVQIEVFEAPQQIFTDEYVYFSSYSETWLAHARSYVDAVSARFALGDNHRVVEIASNDGYLLQYFTARGVPVLGIEPAANVARAAEQKGVSTRVEFFSAACAGRLAAEGIAADLIVANNVLAHVPSPNDFVEGIQVLLAPGGVATLEFPHLLRLIEHNQFDTIYHEHFSYFSLLAAERLLAAHRLRVFDVEELPTHGGSLRLYVCPAAARSYEGGARLAKVRADERQAALHSLDGYQGFQSGVRETKRALIEILSAAKHDGRRVAGYGAAAKGNTLLNYCGVRGDMIDYVADLSPHKQGRFLPGSHIPVVPPERVRETRPDLLLVLPWNIKEEIMAQNACIRGWGGRFLIPIPHPQVI